MNTTSYFINQLKQYRGVIPKQKIKTLKGQIIAGDYDGYRKGLQTILLKANLENKEARK